MPNDQSSGPYLEAIGRGFQFAREQGRGCGPVDFLVGLSEGQGAAAAALDLGHRQVGLRDRWFWLRTVRYYRGSPQP